jgi:hypothetical protein
VRDDDERRHDDGDRHDKPKGRPQPRANLSQSEQQSRAGSRR